MSKASFIEQEQQIRSSIPFNLQLFGNGGSASESGQGEDAGQGEGAEVGQGANGGNNGGEGSQVNSFDDLLKDKAHQAEFDRRISKALETAKVKWETEAQRKVEEAKTEAEKLAKMNAEQKAKYAEEKRIAELEKREREITVRELKAQAYETLAEKGLPKELVDILDYKDAESCNNSIEKVSAAFQAAVEKVVNEKLRGNGTPKGGQSGGMSAADAALRKAFGLD